MERDEFRDILSENIGSPVVPLSSLGQMADGNMANLSPTIPINISCDPGKVENIYIGAGCSPDEIKEYTELLKSFVTYFLGHTRKFQISTLVLSNMRLIPIRMRSPFDNVCVR